MTAEAIPVAGASPEADIQAVIDALKDQMQSLTPHAASIVEDVEANLRINGVLSPEQIAALDHRLHVSSSWIPNIPTLIQLLCLGFPFGRNAIPRNPC